MLEDLMLGSTAYARSTRPLRRSCASSVSKTLARSGATCCCCLVPPAVDHCPKVVLVLPKVQGVPQWVGLSWPIHRKLCRVTGCLLHAFSCGFSGAADLDAVARAGYGWCHLALAVL
uniref:Uncharacterized protein n=1 Tax=Trypanosoma congolense (strain IL3000) TaxID=1068625 RepID=F9WAM4_TRYCI|nr:hypothetical protein, unlikely [Trypanosoma congolense IL3000]